MSTAGATRATCVVRDQVRGSAAEVEGLADLVRAVDHRALAQIAVRDALDALGQLAHRPADAQALQDGQHHAQQHDHAADEQRVDGGEALALLDARLDASRALGDTAGVCEGWAQLARELEPQIRALLPDPRRLKDMEVAAARVLKAVRARERIAILRRTLASEDEEVATLAALALGAEHLDVAEIRHQADLLAQAA